MSLALSNFMPAPCPFPADLYSPVCPSFAQVCDKGLTLGDLIGTLEQFFKRLGLPKLRFKPAFNPYTEPSMEIFSYSEELGKWMEVGNSGMFRPEMLEPMGLPEDVTVIAWGLSLERCCAY